MEWSIALLIAGAVIITIAVITAGLYVNFRIRRRRAIKNIADKFTVWTVMKVAGPAVKQERERLAAVQGDGATGHPTE